MVETPQSVTTRHSALERSNLSKQPTTQCFLRTWLVLKATGVVKALLAVNKREKRRTRIIVKRFSCVLESDWCYKSNRIQIKFYELVMILSLICYIGISFNDSTMSSPHDCRFSSWCVLWSFVVERWFVLHLLFVGGCEAWHLRTSVVSNMYGDSVRTN